MPTGYEVFSSLALFALDEDIRAKVERFLADRKDKKMPTKLSPDNQVVNYTIENLEKSNEEFCHNFLKVAKTMETIGNSMQQTVR